MNEQATCTYFYNQAYIYTIDDFRYINSLCEGVYRSWKYYINHHIQKLEILNEFKLILVDGKQFKVDDHNHHVDELNTRSCNHY